MTIIFNILMLSVSKSTTKLEGSTWRVYDKSLELSPETTIGCTKSNLSDAFSQVYHY